MTSLIVPQKDKSLNQAYLLEYLSAYEVKNNYCSFLRLFEIKMNGVFLFEISSFVMEILRFL